ncbi:spore coat U domain-containing protein [Novosphingobium sp. JCM 18896]|uniref:Csu type fimbrial protein n=1 Tax=Novosphingobium sp. JCM 18896 TaxID=2989731 RepID=UPI002223DBEF|nr:spore coat U domain-containing protein [Novosphingobium sp. JCM 18896]MCW1430813.1 spore coat U domain-containing protein [Novosphingobium sp. JCM 18896]
MRGSSCLRRKAAVAAGLCLFARSPAQAEEIRIDIRFEVRSGCAVAAGTGELALPDVRLSFGEAAAGAGEPIDAMAAAGGGVPLLTLSCSSSFTNDAAPTVVLDAGLNAEDGQRRMRGPGGATVPYLLFQDQACSIPYDPTTPTQISIPTAGIGVPLAIYGRVPVIGDLPAGRYADTVTLTLSY